MQFIELKMIDPHIANLKVNRPEVRNALHWEAMNEFSQVIEGLKSDPDVRVLLIGGAGKAFISGADLGLVNTLDTKEEGERLATLMGEALAEMRSLPLLTIALIDGPARGGGAEIAVSCDFRFITTGATIGFVQTSLGLIPGWGGANRLFDLVGYSKALEFLATAKVIDAEEALRVGLVNAVFADEDIKRETLDFARQVTANSWPAIKSLKELFLVWETDGTGRHRLSERAKFIKLWTQDERREKIAKIMEKSP
jgi:enoyl-CoA hydratase